MNDYLNITLRGESIFLSSRRCLWWPQRQTLIVSDLHLGKGISFSQRATLLPPYDIMDTLNRLEQLVMEMNPQHVICLGDNFHRVHSWFSLADSERQSIHKLVRHVREWIWITGNHDAQLPEEVPGIHADSLDRFPFSFYHQPCPNSLGKVQIVGHYHPKYTTTLHRRRLAKPCFAWTQDLLVMPAFGSYTGGLAINHPEFQKVLRSTFYVATADTHPCPVIVRQ